MIGFNSGKYDINMVKMYFPKEVSHNKGMSVMRTCLLGRSLNF